MENNNNSIFKVLFYSILLILFSELTKFGSFFIAITFFLSIIFIIFIKKVNFLELFSVLIIVSSFGQILRGANGYVTYLSLIFSIILLFRFKSFRFKFPWIFLVILIPQLLTLLNIKGDFSSIAGFISLLGIFSSVLFIRNINWTKSNLYFFFKVICIIPFFSIVITVLDLINFDSSLFIFSTNVFEESNFLNLNKYGTFGSSELMAEAMMISAIVSLNSISIAKKSSDFYFFLCSLIISVILVIFSFSRSIIILTSILIVVSLLLGPLKILSLKNLGILLMFSLIIQLNLNQDELKNKFTSDTDFIENFLDNPFLAENTSREYVFKLAIDKIFSKPYFFGDGYSLPEENKKTWLGSESENWADYHNLYFSIIPLFGWIALSLYLLLIIIALNNSIKNFRVHRKKDIVISTIYFVFTLLIIGTTIGQFKINGLRTGAYFYFLFTLLYLSHMKISKNKIQ